MTQTYDLTGIVQKVETLRRTAEELKAVSGGMQAVEVNVDRILAVVRLLELNFCDVAELS